MSDTYVLGLHILLCSYYRERTLGYLDCDKVGKLVRGFALEDNDHLH